jgi:gas vesicle protein
MSRHYDHWTSFASAFALGMGVGAALGVILAPHSGQDTRAYLRDKAQETVDEAVAQGRNLSRRSAKAVNQAADVASHVVDSANDAMR